MVIDVFKYTVYIQAIQELESTIFESALRAIGYTLWEDAGYSSELDWIEQTSWLLEVTVQT